jgi:hypothetical protein
LLLPILATKPNGLFKVRIVLENPNGPAPILLSRKAGWVGAQLSELLLDVFHAFFKCLRHAGNLDHGCQGFDNEMKLRPSAKAGRGRAGWRR